MPVTTINGREIHVDDEEFLDQIVAAGGHLWGCRMSADMMKLEEKIFVTMSKASSPPQTSSGSRTAPSCCSSDRRREWPRDGSR